MRPLPALAQQPAKLHRVAYVGLGARLKELVGTNPINQSTSFQQLSSRACVSLVMPKVRIYSLSGALPKVAFGDCPILCASWFPARWM